MPLDIVGDFFSIINAGLFDAVSVVLFISFIIWELPRTVKIISEEYTKGLYPEYGRVADVILFVIGICAMAYLMLGNTAKVVTFLRTPGITSFFLILMVSIPLIIALGFFKRLFARVDKHESVTIFLVHGFLDSMRTLFYISLALLAIPVIGHLIMGK